MGKSKIKKGPWDFHDSVKKYKEGKFRESTNVNLQHLSRTQLLTHASKAFFDHKECEAFVAGVHTINRTDADAVIAYKEYVYSL